jgi:hypothetical protein
VLGLLLDHCRRQAERQGFLAGRLQQVAGHRAHEDRDRVEQRQSGHRRGGRADRPAAAVAQRRLTAEDQ